MLAILAGGIFGLFIALAMANPVVSDSYIAYAPKQTIELSPIPASVREAISASEDAHRRAPAPVSSKRHAAHPDNSAASTTDQAIEQLQYQLARLNCFDGATDGVWSVEFHQGLEQVARIVELDLKNYESADDLIDMLSNTEPGLCGTSQVALTPLSTHVQQAEKSNQTVSRPVTPIPEPRIAAAPKSLEKRNRTASWSDVEIAARDNDSEVSTVAFPFSDRWSKHPDQRRNTTVEPDGNSEEVTNGNIIPTSSDAGHAAESAAPGDARTVVPAGRVRDQEIVSRHDVASISSAPPEGVHPGEDAAPLAWAEQPGAAKQTVEIRTPPLPVLNRSKAIAQSDAIKVTADAGESTSLTPHVTQERGLRPPLKQSASTRRQPARRITKSKRKSKAQSRKTPARKKIVTAKRKAKSPSKKSRAQKWTNTRPGIFDRNERWRYKQKSTKK